MVLIPGLTASCAPAQTVSLGRAETKEHCLVTFLGPDSVVSTWDTWPHGEISKPRVSSQGNAPHPLQHFGALKKREVTN